MVKIMQTNRKWSQNTNSSSKTNTETDNTSHVAYNNNKLYYTCPSTMLKHPLTFHSIPTCG